MEIKAQIDVARILVAIDAKRLRVMDTCALCGINNKTLQKILKGEFPKRLDAFFRLCNGLGIPVEEALISGSTSNSPRFQVLRGGRQSA